MAEERMRMQLVLGKFKVLEVKHQPPFWYVFIQMGREYPRFELPFKPDLHPGDLLTLYTEVFPHADPIKPPIQ